MKFRNLLLTYKALISMSFLSKLFGCKRSATPQYACDELTINGRKLRLYFFAHASIAIEFEERFIYVDPVVGHAEYEKLPKADIILVSDTSMLGAELPSLTTGLRGLAYWEVEVTGPNRDLHSGHFGGAVANPINVL